MHRNDKPILMQPDMVRALLDGRKIQTRRVIKPQPEFSKDIDSEDARNIAELICLGAEGCPYGERGDLLWARETYYQRGYWEEVPGVKTNTGRQKWKFVPADDVIVFDAPSHFRRGRHHKDPYTVEWHKRIGRFMPKRYSRITLRIDDIRVERLKDISEEDARSEGIQDGGCLECGNPEPCGCGDPKPSAKEGFLDIWNDIHGPDSVIRNPWVWAIEFTPYLMNVDEFKQQEPEQ